MHLDITVKETFPIVIAGAIWGTKRGVLRSHAIPTIRQWWLSWAPEAVVAIMGSRSCHDRHYCTCCNEFKICTMNSKYATDTYLPATMG